MNKTVVVKFDSMGGKEVESMTIEYGFMIHVPVTQKIGYNFVGWYKDNEFKEEFNPNKIIENNLTLYAKWENYAPKKFINDISVYTNLSNVVKDYQEIYGYSKNNKTNIEESDAIKLEKERISKNNFIRDITKEFNEVNDQYKKCALELHKASVSLEKAKEKMQNKIEKKGKEKCEKQIALYNEAQENEKKIKGNYDKIIQKLDSISKTYEKFAKENR